MNLFLQALPLYGAPRVGSFDSSIAAALNESFLKLRPSPAELFSSMRNERSSCSLLSVHSTRLLPVVALPAVFALLLDGDMWAGYPISRFFASLAQVTGPELSSAGHMKQNTHLFNPNLTTTYHHAVVVPTSSHKSSRKKLKMGLFGLSGVY